MGAADQPVVNQNERDLDAIHYARFLTTLAQFGVNVTVLSYEKPAGRGNFKKKPVNLTYKLLPGVDASAIVTPDSLVDFRPLTRDERRELRGKRNTKKEARKGPARRQKGRLK